MAYINQLPDFYYDSPLVNLIQNTFETEYMDIKQLLEDMRNQIFLDETNEEGIKYWEDLVGIDGTGLALTTRIANVKLKFAGAVTTTEARIKEIVKMYTGKDPVLEVYHADYYFKVIFKAPSYDLVKTLEVIENVKPAHLGVVYEFEFNTHAVLGQYTHEHLSKFTHEEIVMLDLSSRSNKREFTKQEIVELIINGGYDEFIKNTTL